MIFGFNTGRKYLAILPYYFITGSLCFFFILWISTILSKTYSFNRIVKHTIVVLLCIRVCGHIRPIIFWVWKNILVECSGGNPIGILLSSLYTPIVSLLVSYHYHIFPLSKKKKGFVNRTLQDNHYEGTVLFSPKRNSLEKKIHVYWTLYSSIIHCSGFNVT